MVTIKSDVKNNRGFTLIELLAVIIILGVLMIIAIPSVTKLINDSRKSGYVSTAKEIVGAARNFIHSGNLDFSDKDTTYYINGKCLETDNGLKSPYGELNKSYVAVVLNGDNYEYYWMSADDTNTGVATLKRVDDLEDDDIEGDVDPTGITPTIGIDNREKIVVIDGDSCTKTETNEIPKVLNTSTGRVKDACPATYTPIIYWALQDTNSDGKNDKLVLSDSSVSGNLSGSVPGNVRYDEDSLPPWVGEPLPDVPETLSSDVTNVEIIGQVAPLNPAFFFIGVGLNAPSIRADLNNFEMCHATSMRGIFTGFGGMAQNFYLDIREWDTRKVTDMEGAFSANAAYAQTWEIYGLERLNTSNVTNMDGVFAGAFLNVPSVNLDLSNWDTKKVTSMISTFNAFGANSNSVNLNINNWNTKNVTDMTAMFDFFGQNATSWNVTGLNGFDTSNVVNMNGMFYASGINASSINLNLNNWNTSNVESMDEMFAFVGQYSQNVNINIKDWDTSKVTNMHRMFCSVGYGATSINIDLSNINTSNVSNITDMFGCHAGYSATTSSFKIPSSNKNGINNTTSRIYGKNSSTYASAPTNKQFTLPS